MEFHYNFLVGENDSSKSRENGATIKYYELLLVSRNFWRKLPKDEGGRTDDAPLSSSKMEEKLQFHNHFFFSFQCFFTSANTSSHSWSASRWSLMMSLRWKRGWNVLILTLLLRCCQIRNRVQNLGVSQAAWLSCLRLFQPRFESLSSLKIKWKVSKFPGI